MESTINLVDVLLGAVILLSVWSAWRRGFVLAFTELLVLALSVVAAFFAYRYPAQWFERHLPSLEVWSLPLAFLLSFLLARILIGSLAYRALARVPRNVHAHHANRWLGVLPGLVNGAVNALVLAVLLLAVPLFDGLTLMARESVLATRLALPAEWAESKLSPIFEQAAQRTLNRLTVRPGSRETIQLPFTVSAPKVREDLEAGMLALVNEARRAEGLPPLEPDPQAREVARQHARDMWARGYFSHVSPEGQDPFERLRQGRVRFLVAGENLALARSLRAAHQGLMESPGHRANILRPAFGRLGVGVLDGGRYGLMVVQNFRN